MSDYRWDDYGEPRPEVRGWGLVELWLLPVWALALLVWERVCGNKRRPE